MSKLGSKPYNRPIGASGGKGSNFKGMPFYVYSGKPRPLNYYDKSEDQQDGEVKIIKPANK